MRRFLLPAVAAAIALAVAAASFAYDVGDAVAWQGASPSRFEATFDGDPDRPQRFSDPDWDVSIMTRDRESWVRANPGNVADHGYNCSAPPRQHRVWRLEDMVYTCKNHLMTAMNDDSFGVVTLTPNHMLDLSAPEATLSFDISTARNDGYDWIEIVLSPFEDNLVHPAADIWQVAGPPDNSISIAMTPGGTNHFQLTTHVDGAAKRYDFQTCNAGCAGVDTDATYPSAQIPLVTDKKRRETFELTLTNDGRLSFGVIDFFDGTDTDQSFYWLDNVDVPTLDWDSAVVQLQHFSFNPTNNCGDPSCDGDTWHWDDVTIEPAVPFSIIPSKRRFVDPALGSYGMGFEAKSGPNSFLRFSAIGENVEISIDGGQTWQFADLQRTAENDPQLTGRFRNYFHPIPAGVRWVRFRADNWWGGEWHVRDLSIWSQTIE